jgi:hypothetical protein
MNQLQLAKSRVEIVAKREALLTDIDAWNNYRAELATRTAKLSHVRRPAIIPYLKPSHSFKLFSVLFLWG